MKKSSIYGILSIVLIVGMFFTGCASKNNASQLNTNVSNLPIHQMHASFVYDTDNIREAVGICDYVFVAKVVSCDGTECWQAVSSFLLSVCLKNAVWQSGRQLRQSRSLSAGQYGMCLLSLFLFLPIQVRVQHLFTRTSDITIHKRRRGSHDTHEFVSWLLIFMCNFVNKCT